MVQFTISLPEPLRDYVNAQIDDGRSASVDEFLRGLIQADREEQERFDQWTRDPRVEQLVREGFASGDAGPMTDDDWESLTRPFHEQVKRDASTES
ncbi:MAG: hypothetical protein KY475_05685 [Planctomycetes bacterium]|nr:hypothetical protein [Planctomycetota bacterium]